MGLEGREGLPVITGSVWRLSEVFFLIGVVEFRLGGEILLAGPFPDTPHTVCGRGMIRVIGAGGYGARCKRLDCGFWILGEKEYWMLDVGMDIVAKYGEREPNFWVSMEPWNFNIQLWNLASARAGAAPQCLSGWEQQRQFYLSLSLSLAISPFQCELHILVKAKAVVMRKLLALYGDNCKVLEVEYDSKWDDGAVGGLYDGSTLLGDSLLGIGLRRRMGCMDAVLTILCFKVGPEWTSCTWL
ncbi:hypothetical protein FA15DRAFT_656031 [Coprinopsis marcescibilis]|uniref:Uncharacterized protein n=1 Tax=Coprinopsis marcescibilis TaxID=230819 RepID=A0A5C3KVB0_COPMA|nr:hypothetical protein FA15DRAFT_656031 [Coprinopsis marcescibilis]